MEKSDNKTGGMKGVLKPAIRVVILMLLVAGVGYPLSLMAIGQVIFPFQSNGSVVNVEGRAAGSILIAQEFTSPKFFHARPASDSASGVDPHIIPEDAFSQVTRISEATGIAENPLKTLIRLNIERGRSENLGAFAPDYVNVLTINLDLVDQYPEEYKEFLGLRIQDKE
jgi:potassium-transporting ATPase KdpC subunit